MQAHIRAALSFDGATFTNEGGSALSADGLTVEGSMLCGRRFAAIGQMSLVNAKIHGQLSFETASLANKDGHALDGSGLVVEGDMFCHADFAGEVRLIGARIQRQLSFEGASLGHRDGARADDHDSPALNLFDGQVPGTLFLQFGAPPAGAVDLRGARVGTLHDCESTWPCELYLRNLTYDNLDTDDVEMRLEWLERDPVYAPQPYEQLVSFYRQTGNEPHARRVAIAKQRRRRATLSAPGKAGSLVLGATVGYGYRAWLAGVWLLVLWGVGSALVGLAHPQYFKAAKPVDQVPPFNSLLYTLDLILPIVKYLPARCVDRHWTRRAGGASHDRRLGTWNRSHRRADRTAQERLSAAMREPPPSNTLRFRFQQQQRRPSGHDQTRARASSRGGMRKSGPREALG